MLSTGRNWHRQNSACNTPTLLKVPECLWASSSTDTRIINSVEPIQFLIDYSKPLSKLTQYLRKSEAIQRLSPTVEDLIK